MGCGGLRLFEPIEPIEGGCGGLDALLLVAASIPQEHYRCTDIRPSTSPSSSLFSSLSILLSTSKGDPLLVFFSLDHLICLRMHICDTGEAPTAAGPVIFPTVLSISTVDRSIKAASSDRYFASLPATTETPANTTLRGSTLLPSSAPSLATTNLIAALAINTSAHILFHPLSHHLAGS